MTLNLKKCVNLTTNRVQSSIRFKDRTLVPRKSRATVLGAILTDDIDNHAEVANRLRECTIVTNKLKLFWNKAET